MSSYPVHNIFLGADLAMLAWLFCSVAADLHHSRVWRHPTGYCSSALLSRGEVMLVSGNAGAQKLRKVDQVTVVLAMQQSGAVSKVQ
jgi:hypothetical protein